MAEHEKQDDDELNLRQKVMALVKEFPDFPTKGVLFRDLLPLFTNPRLLKSLCKFIADRYRGHVDVVAGLEARGFLFGPIVALELDLPFLPIRKKGKLPGLVFSVDYVKEYGTDVIEIQQGILLPEQRVLLLDDLLATGGTLQGAEQLIKKAGAKVAAIFVIAELNVLGGRRLLTSPVETFLSFST